MSHDIATGPHGEPEGLDWTANFGRIADAAGGLRIRAANLDGELWSSGEDGTSDSNALQDYVGDGHRNKRCILDR